MKSGVYEIRNSVNGSKYIGSSADVQKRLRGHANALRANTHPNPHLLSAYRKYGRNKFVYSPILYCDPDMTLAYEQICLDEMQPEYNIAKYAKAPNKGRKMSGETRSKISVALKGRGHSLEHRSKISDAMKGRKQTDEHIENNVKANTGLVRSEETKKRISRSMKGNKRALGYKQTEETRRNMSKAAKRRYARERGEA